MKTYKMTTDLALESAEMCDKRLPHGVFVEEKTTGNLKKTVVKIETDGASLRLGREKGDYITIEGDFMFKDEYVSLLEKEIKKLLPKGNILVAGLGNLSITPDALGPLTAFKIMATTHLEEGLKRKISEKGLRGVSSIAPGSSGQTGIETGKIIKAIVKEGLYSAVIAVDALSSLSCKRLGRTVQLSSVGLAPGSGVGNKRSEISFETMGIPVISIGIPTVASSFITEEDDEGENMLLAPKDIDIIVKRGSEIISKALNYALFDNIKRESLNFLL